MKQSNQPMISLFDTPYNSTVLISLAIGYGIVTSITTLDIRLIQAKKSGMLPADEPLLPKWVGLFHWLEWLILAVMFLLNWKFALIAWGVKFILMVVPVLEIIGNILMAPFKSKK